MTKIQNTSVSAAAQVENKKVKKQQQKKEQQVFKGNGNKQTVKKPNDSALKQEIYKKTGFQLKDTANRGKIIPLKVNGKVREYETVGTLTTGGRILVKERGKEVYHVVSHTKDNKLVMLKDDYAKNKIFYESTSSEHKVKYGKKNYVITNSKRDRHGRMSAIDENGKRVVLSSDGKELKTGYVEAEDQKDNMNDYIAKQTKGKSKAEADKIRQQIMSGNSSYSNKGVLRFKASNGEVWYYDTKRKTYVKYAEKEAQAIIKDLDKGTEEDWWLFTTSAGTNYELLRNTNAQIIDPEVLNKVNKHYSAEYGNKVDKNAQYGSGKYKTAYEAFLASEIGDDEVYLFNAALVKNNAITDQSRRNEILQTNLTKISGIGVEGLGVGVNKRANRIAAADAASTKEDYQALQDAAEEENKKNNYKAQFKGQDALQTYIYGVQDGDVQEIEDFNNALIDPKEDMLDRDEIVRIKAETGVLWAKKGNFKKGFEAQDTDVTKQMFALQSSNGKAVLNANTLKQQAAKEKQDDYLMMARPDLYNDKELASRATQLLKIALHDLNNYHSIEFQTPTYSATGGYDTNAQAKVDWIKEAEENISRAYSMIRNDKILAMVKKEMGNNYNLLLQREQEHLKTDSLKNITTITDTQVTEYSDKEGKVKLTPEQIAHNKYVVTWLKSQLSDIERDKKSNEAKEGWKQDFVNNTRELLFGGVTRASLADKYNLIKSNMARLEAAAEGKLVDASGKPVSFEDAMKNLGETGIQALEQANADYQTAQQAGEFMVDMVTLAIPIPGLSVGNLVRFSGTLYKIVGTTGKMYKVVKVSQEVVKGQKIVNYVVNEAKTIKKATSLATKAVKEAEKAEKAKKIVRFAEKYPKLDKVLKLADSSATGAMHMELKTAALEATNIATSREGFTSDRISEFNEKVKGAGKFGGMGGFIGGSTAIASEFVSSAGVKYAVHGLGLVADVAGAAGLMTAESHGETNFWDNLRCVNPDGSFNFEQASMTAMMIFGHLHGASTVKGKSKAQVFDEITTNNDLQLRYQKGNEGSYEYFNAETLKWEPTTKEFFKERVDRDGIKREAHSVKLENRELRLDNDGIWSDAESGRKFRLVKDNKGRTQLAELTKKEIYNSRQKTEVKDGMTLEDFRQELKNNDLRGDVYTKADGGKLVTVKHSRNKYELFEFDNNNNMISKKSVVGKSAINESYPEFANAESSGTMGSTSGYLGANMIKVKSNKSEKVENLQKTVNKDELTALCNELGITGTQKKSHFVGKINGANTVINEMKGNKTVKSYIVSRDAEGKAHIEIKVSYKNGKATDAIIYNDDGTIKKLPAETKQALLEELNKPAEKESPADSNHETNKPVESLPDDWEIPENNMTTFRRNKNAVTDIENINPEDISVSGNYTGYSHFSGPTEKSLGVNGDIRMFTSKGLAVAYDKAKNITVITTPVCDAFNRPGGIISIKVKGQVSEADGIALVKNLKKANFIPERMSTIESPQELGVIGRRIQQETAKFFNEKQTNSARDTKVPVEKSQAVPKTEQESVIASEGEANSIKQKPAGKTPVTSQEQSTGKTPEEAAAIYNEEMKTAGTTPVQQTKAQQLELERLQTLVQSNEGKAILADAMKDPNFGKPISERVPDEGFKMTEDGRLQIEVDGVVYTQRNKGDTFLVSNYGKILEDYYGQKPISPSATKPNFTRLYRDGDGTIFGIENQYGAIDYSRQSLAPEYYPAGKPNTSLNLSLGRTTENYIMTDNVGRVLYNTNPQLSAFSEYNSTKVRGRGHTKSDSNIVSDLNQAIQDVNLKNTTFSTKKGRQKAYEDVRTQIENAYNDNKLTGQDYDNLVANLNAKAEKEGGLIVRETRHQQYEAKRAEAYETNRDLLSDKIDRVATKSDYDNMVVEINEAFKSDKIDSNAASILNKTLDAKGELIEGVETLSQKKAKIEKQVSEIETAQRIEEVEANSQHRAELLDEYLAEFGENLPSEIGTKEYYDEALSTIDRGVKNGSIEPQKAEVLRTQAKEQLAKLELESSQPATEPPVNASESNPTKTGSKQLANVEPKTPAQEIVQNVEKLQTLVQNKDGKAFLDKVKQDPNFGKTAEERVPSDKIVKDSDGNIQSIEIDGVTYTLKDGKYVSDGNSTAKVFVDTDSYYVDSNKVVVINQNKITTIKSKDGVNVDYDTTTGRPEKVMRSSQSIDLKTGVYNCYGTEFDIAGRVTKQNLLIFIKKRRYHPNKVEGDRYSDSHYDSKGKWLNPNLNKETKTNLSKQIEDAQLKTKKAYDDVRNQIEDAYNNNTINRETADNLHAKLNEKAKANGLETQETPTMVAEREALAEWDKQADILKDNLMSDIKKVDSQATHDQMVEKIGEACNYDKIDMERANELYDALEAKVNNLDGVESLAKKAKRINNELNAQQESVTQNADKSVETDSDSNSGGSEESQGTPETENSVTKEFLEDAIEKIKTQEDAKKYVAKLEEASNKGIISEEEYYDLFSRADKKANVASEGEANPAGTDPENINVYDKRIQETMTIEDAKGLAEKYNNVEVVELENGNYKLKVTSKDTEGQIKTTIESEHLNGNVVKSTKSEYEKGELVGITESEYKDGNLVEETWVSADGNKTKITKNEYKDGTLIKSREELKTNNITKITEKEYKDDNVVKDRITNENSITEGEYNKDNKLIKETIKDVNGNITEIRKFEYKDQNFRPTKQTQTQYKDGKVVKITEYEFDDGYKLIKTTQKDADGNITQVTEREYSKINGTPTKETKTQFKDGKPTEITETEYEDLTPIKEINKDADGNITKIYDHKLQRELTPEEINNYIKDSLEKDINNIKTQEDVQECIAEVGEAKEKGIITEEQYYEFVEKAGEKLNKANEKNNASETPAPENNGEGIQSPFEITADKFVVNGKEQPIPTFEEAQNTLNHHRGKEYSIEAGDGNRLVLKYDDNGSFIGSREEININGKALKDISRNADGTIDHTIDYLYTEDGMQVDLHRDSNRKPTNINWSNKHITFDKEGKASYEVTNEKNETINKPIEEVLKDSPELKPLLEQQGIKLVEKKAEEASAGNANEGQPVTKKSLENDINNIKTQKDAEEYIAKLNEVKDKGLITEEEYADFVEKAGEKLNAEDAARNNAGKVEETNNEGQSVTPEPEKQSVTPDGFPKTPSKPKPKPKMLEELFGDEQVPKTADEAKKYAEAHEDAEFVASDDMLFLDKKQNNIVFYKKDGTIHSYRVETRATNGLKVEFYDATKGNLKEKNLYSNENNVWTGHVITFDSEGNMTKAMKIVQNQNKETKPWEKTAEYEYNAKDNVFELKKGDKVVSTVKYDEATEHWAEFDAEGNVVHEIKKPDRRKGSFRAKISKATKNIIDKFRSNKPKNKDGVTIPKNLRNEDGTGLKNGFEYDKVNKQYKKTVTDKDNKNITTIYDSKGKKIKEVSKKGDDKTEVIFNDKGKKVTTIETSKDGTKLTEYSKKYDLVIEKDSQGKKKLTINYKDKEGNAPKTEEFTYYNKDKKVYENKSSEEGPVFKSVEYDADKHSWTIRDGEGKKLDSQNNMKKSHIKRNTGLGLVTSAVFLYVAAKIVESYENDDEDKQVDTQKQVKPTPKNITPAPKAETKVTLDGKEGTIAEDGTLTLDGKKYPKDTDGTYTIGDKKYKVEDGKLVEVVDTPDDNGETGGAAPETPDVTGTIGDKEYIIKDGKVSVDGTELTPDENGHYKIGDDKYKIEDGKLVKVESEEPAKTDTDTDAAQSDGSQTGGGNTGGSTSGTTGSQGGGRTGGSTSGTTGSQGGGRTGGSTSGTTGTTHNDTSVTTRHTNVPAEESRANSTRPSEQSGESRHTGNTPVTGGTEPTKEQKQVANDLQNEIANIKTQEELKAFFAKAISAYNAGKITRMQLDVLTTQVENYVETFDNVSQWLDEQNHIPEPEFGLGKVTTPQEQQPKEKQEITPVERMDLTKKIKDAKNIEDIVEIQREMRQYKVFPGRKNLRRAYKAKLRAIKHQDESNADKYNIKFQNRMDKIKESDVYKNDQQTIQQKKLFQSSNQSDTSYSLANLFLKKNKPNEDFQA